MGKDPKIDAENSYLKAQKLYKAAQYKKSGKNFYAAGNSFLKLLDNENAQKAYILGAEAFDKANKQSSSLELMRLAGEISIMKSQYEKADKIYQNALKYVTGLTNSKEQYYYYVLFPVLSYLCLFVKEKPDDGLELVKKYQKKVDSEYFKENTLIKLVTDLTLVLRNKSRSSFERVTHDIDQYKMRNSELGLLKKILILAQIYLNIKIFTELDKESYTTNDMLKLTLYVDLKDAINEVRSLNQDLSNFKINNVVVKLSDNLATSEKPSYPVTLDINKIHKNSFIIKPHFQKDESYIGPISLHCEINDELLLRVETDVIKVALLSPPPLLDVSFKSLRTPLIGQSFPVELNIENPSQGDALDVNVNLIFPDEIKIMRGTTDKQIYSLRKNENIKWELNIKPMEAGDYSIKVEIDFKDEDQNSINMVKEFPFPIKL
jgi:tetratricopeptide (TPR) repeat protein